MSPIKKTWIFPREKGYGQLRSAGIYDGSGPSCVCVPSNGQDLLKNAILHVCAYVCECDSEFVKSSSPRVSLSACVLYSSLCSAIFSLHFRHATHPGSPILVLVFPEVWISPRYGSETVFPPSSQDT